MTDEVGLSKSTVYPKRRVRLFTREDIHTFPSALVQFCAGNSRKSSGLCPHHLQEGDKRMGRNRSQEDVCLSVTEFAGKRAPLLHLLHHDKATGTGRAVSSQLTGNFTQSAC